MAGPEEVDPRIARRVLCFLNAVDTPEELSAAVEIAGETDIGLRLSRRILTRRDELGGFASLAQVADVPLIGPERFGELVQALGACRVARALEGAGSGGEEADSDLRAEVARLRGLVEGLSAAVGAHDRLTLRAVAERPYFGQRVTVAARLTDALGREPRVDAPVTFVAAWGRLRSEGGLSRQDGDTVTARTGADGTARVTLLPPAAEDLDPDQELALEAALADLDPGAPDPGAAAGALRELARQYRWDAALHFRQAVDVYVRHFRSALLDTVNRWDAWAVWPLVQSTVLAFAVGDGAEGTEVRTSAALTLRQRNWLPAFVEASEAVAREQSTLTAELRDAKGKVADKGRFLGEVHGRVQEFLEGQRGLVGEYVGRRLAETELSRFAADDLEDLPVAVRVDVFPALQTAAGAVAEAGGRLVAALGQTRLDLGKDLDVKIGQLDTEVLGERVGALEGLVGGKLDASVFDGFRGELDGRFGAKADAAVLDGLKGELASALAAKVDQTSFAAFQSQTNQALAAKVDQAVFADFQHAVDDRLDLKAGLADLAGIDQRLTSQLKAKADAISLQGLRQELQGKLDSVNQRLDQKADLTAVNALRTDLTGALAQKADAAAVNAELSTLRDRTGTLDQRLQSLNTSVTRLDGNVSGLLRPAAPVRPVPRDREG